MSYQRDNFFLLVDICLQAIYCFPDLGKTSTDRITPVNSNLHLLCSDYDALRVELKSTCHFLSSRKEFLSSDEVQA